MRVFAENPNSVLDEFSAEFERGYLETLNQLHGTKRVKANTVYQEYIADKHHIHMNATIWTTLTGLLMHLGKESKAIVDETEKGWFIQYIDRDPKVLARQAQSEQRQRFELDEEERKKREIAAQVQAAEQWLDSTRGGDEQEEEVDNSLVRDDNTRIAVALKIVGSVSASGGGGNSGASAAAPSTGLPAPGGVGATIATAATITTSAGLKKRPRQAIGFGDSSSDEEGNGAEKLGVERAQANTGTKLQATAGAGAGAVVAGSVPPVLKSSAASGGGVLAQMMKEEEARKARQQHAASTSTAAAPITTASSTSAQAQVAAASSYRDSERHIHDDNMDRDRASVREGKHSSTSTSSIGR